MKYSLSLRTLKFQDALSASGVKQTLPCSQSLRSLRSARDDSAANHHRRGEFQLYPELENFGY